MFKFEENMRLISRNKYKKTNMKPVIQEEITGCAIATTAAIAGISYQEAKQMANHLGICAEDNKLWSDTLHMREMLNHLGIPASDNEMPFTSWERLPDLAILSIKWRIEEGQPFWHWVVFVREANNEYVLDSKQSLKTNIRTDFGRINPKWYIAVNAAPIN